MGGHLVRIDFAADELPGIEFRCFDDEPAVELLFEVVDAATGEAIEDWTAEPIRMSVSPENGVLLHAGPLPTESFPSSSALEWAEESEGYAPAFGNERAFTIDSVTGAWRVRVALERGQAFRLVVLAPEPALRSAAGALVVLDGLAVGATDSMGQLVVRSKERPKVAGIQWRNLRADGALDQVVLERQLYMRMGARRE